MFKESHYWCNGWARPYCGVSGHNFILRLCRRWNEGSLYNSLTFSGEAHGSGHQPSSDFRPVLPYQLRRLLCPDCGNDVKAAKDDSLGLNIHELMHALYDIDKIVWRRVITYCSSNKYRHRHQAFIVLINYSCFALSIMNEQMLIHPFDLFAATIWASQTIGSF